MDPDQGEPFDEQTEHATVKLPADRKLQREIQVRGISAPVIITMSGDGVELRVVGTRTGVTAGWEYVVECFSTPTNVPSHLMDKPMEFLQYQANRLNAETAAVNRLIDSASQ